MESFVSTVTGAEVGFLYVKWVDFCDGTFVDDGYWYASLSLDVIFVFNIFGMRFANDFSV